MKMVEKTWLDYISAIGSFATPVLLLLLTGVGWKYRQSIDRKAKLEEKLRDDRIEIYNSILEPFIIILMKDEAWKEDKKHKGINKDKYATSILLSLDYRKISFKLSLLGSDNVVIAFNNLMQFFYAQSEQSSSCDASHTYEMMSLLGKFLLEIRKSMGNEATKIDNWGMLEWFLTDARQFRNGKN